MRTDINKSYESSFLIQSPAFAHIASQWKACDVWPTLAVLSQDCVVQFAPPLPKSSLFGDQYVVRIARERIVATRTEDWHDLFNALTWRIFPKSKWALNARHYRSLCTRKEGWDIRDPRTREEDICTLINENSIVIAYSHQPDAAAIHNFSWRDLFWTRRKGLQERMELFFLGHALLDKARHPYIGMTGHAILIHVDEGFFVKSIQERVEIIDKRTSMIIEGKAIQKSKDLSPFPVLGFPGFDIRAEKEEFYQNTWYFRAGRRQN